MTVDAGARVGLPAVCPFVAFADERDLRAAGPDHRHRCYAESPPAPRAFAHQSRYCLSPGFPSCPIFQDWAAREAARVSDASGPAPGTFDEGLFDEPLPVDRTAGGGMAPAGEQGDLAAAVPLDFEDFEPAAGAPVPREWERLRPRRDYPRIGRARRTSPVLLGLGALAVAAVILFLLPTLLRGLFGGTGSSPGVSPSGAATETASPTVVGTPTPVPSPTPLTYIVKKGDTLSEIATTYDVTVKQILAVNPQITDPDNIRVGEVIVIPTPTPAPGVSASGSPPP